MEPSSRREALGAAWGRAFLRGEPAAAALAARLWPQATVGELCRLARTRARGRAGGTCQPRGVSGTLPSNGYACNGTETNSYAYDE